MVQMVDTWLTTHVNLLLNRVKNQSICNAGERTNFILHKWGEQDQIGLGKQLSETLDERRQVQSTLTKTWYELGRMVVVVKALTEYFWNKKSKDSQMESNCTYVMHRLKYLPYDFKKHHIWILYFFLIFKKMERTGNLLVKLQSKKMTSPLPPSQVHDS